MNAKSITRQHRDRLRGQLRIQLMDLVGDYDALLADTDGAERERLADKVFRHQENLRAAVAAIDNYDQLKRSCVQR
jgi:hypothetical protein